MSTSAPPLPSIYLKPGDLYFGQAPAKVCTLLGSCVALTLYSPECRAGAICHALLPCAEQGRRSEFHYVDTSIRWMVERFAQEGVGPLRLTAKLFGGSDLIGGSTGRRRIPCVGRRNVDAALAVLEEVGLMLTALDVGGCCGRKVVFFTHTGDVFARRNTRSPVGGPAEVCSGR